MFMKLVDFTKVPILLKEYLRSICLVPLVLKDMSSIQKVVLFEESSPLRVRKRVSILRVRFYLEVNNDSLIRLDELFQGAGLDLKPGVKVRLA